MASFPKHVIKFKKKRAGRKTSYIWYVTLCISQNTHTMHMFKSMDYIEKEWVVASREVNLVPGG